MKLGQSIKMPRLGKITMGQKAPELNLDGARVLKKSPTVTEYDFDGDGRRDLAMETKKGPTTYRHKVTTYTHDASGKETGWASIRYRGDTNKVDTLTTSNKGLLKDYYDWNRDGITDYEYQDVRRGNHTRTVQRERDENGVVTQSVASTTIKNKVDGEDVRFSQFLPVTGFGDVAIGQPVDSLNLTLGNQVSSGDQVATYDRFGDGKTMVTINDVVDAVGAIIEKRVEVVTGKERAYFYVDTGTGKVFSVTTDTEGQYTSLEDANHNGKTDSEASGSYMYATRWTNLTDVDGDDRPDELDTTVS